MDKDILGLRENDLIFTAAKIKDKSVKKHLTREEYNKEYNNRPKVRAHMKEYMKQPKVKAYQREYNQRPEVKLHRNALRLLPKTKKVNYAYRIKWKYGITISDRDALFAAQGGLCAICRTSKFGKYGPVTDHDHITGKVRGMLFTNCNTALGHIKDSVLIAEQMIQYLIKNR